MSIYCFVLRNRSGRVEELGCLPLPNDREAVAFGEAILREAMGGNRTVCPDSALDVIEDERTVAKIQFDPGI
jgi:hypothetical protein